MLYTSYKQEKVFTDRQSAINDSRSQAKLEFVQSVAKVEYVQDDPHEMAYPEVVPVKHDEIVTAYEKYMADRGKVYGLKPVELKSF